MITGLIAGTAFFIGVMAGIVILACSPDISNQDDDDRWWE